MYTYARSSRGNKFFSILILPAVEIPGTIIIIIHVYYPGTVLSVSGPVRLFITIRFRFMKIVNFGSGSTSFGKNNKILHFNTNIL